MRVEGHGRRKQVVHSANEPSNSISSKWKERVERLEMKAHQLSILKDEWGMKLRPKNPLLHQQLRCGVAQPHRGPIEVAHRPDRLRITT